MTYIRGMRPAWTAYLVALHLAVAVVAVHDRIPQRLAIKLGLSPKEDWSGVQWLHEVNLARDPQVPSGSVVFLGDSITQSLAVSAVSPVAVNYGISGQRADQLLQYIGSYGALNRARAVVVMVGTNDVRQGRGDSLPDLYRSILSAIPSHVPVILSGPAGNMPQAVSAAGQACLSDPRCVFVDASAMPPGSLLPDGLHLSSSGYAAWAEKLRSALSGVGQTTVIPRAE